MSLVFHFLVRDLGGLRVDFNGSYLFHRHWLDVIDLATVRSETFVFSFELLERMRRAGSRFAAVSIRPFAREVGQSRVAALRRIVRVLARSPATGCAVSGLLGASHRSRSTESRCPRWPSRSRCRP